MFAGRFSSAIGSVGIDLGTRGIKLLQVREHGGELKVVGAGRVDAKAGDSWVEDRKALTDQLRAAFASGGFTGRRCVLSIPRGEVRMQLVRLPKMPDSELRQAVVWEASQRFGFDREAMEVDAIRTGASLQDGERRDEILLIAVSHDVINAWVEPVMAAGLRPMAIETHFTALARAFSRQSRRESDRSVTRVVLDVGASGSTVMILRGDQIAFCKSISVGGEQFDQAVAEHLQMDVAAARELRAARIAAATDQPNARPITEPSIDRAVYDAVRPLLGTFAKEVMLCIGYYGVMFRGYPPQRLILTGGDGLEPRLDETLLQQCRIPVVLDEDGSTVSCLMEQIQAILHRAPGPPAWWAVAAVLSLRGISVGTLKRLQAVTCGTEAA